MCSPGRAAALGKLGMSNSVGMVIGPLVGGIITQKFSGQTACYIAAVLSAGCMVLVLLFIPQNTKPSVHKDMSKQGLSL